MTREELIAQAEALEWAATTPWPEYIDSRSAILAKANYLRAQAEAMPRIVREGRDFDVKFHDNGAAQRDEATGTGQRTEPQCPSPSGIRQAALQDDPAAAPPSATQPVAWIQSNHLDNIRRDHRFHCSLADHKFQSDYRPLYTAPPDLAARVARLEDALRGMLELAEYWFMRENRRGYSEEQYKAWYSLGFDSNEFKNARAALANGE